MGEKDLFAQCLEASEAILCRWGWTLLTAEDLAQRVEAYLMATAPAGLQIQQRVIRHSALRLYGLELYQACGHQDIAMQERAFTELWAYLYPIALHKAEEATLAQDATQQTLLAVWEKQTQCRDPHSFLNWATMIVINQVWDALRRASMAVPGEGETPKRQRREVLMADLRGNDRDSEQIWSEVFAHRELGLKEEGPDRALLRRESRAQLVAALEKSLRSPQQRQVIIGLFIEEKGVLELAQELGTTPANVYTLKSRALARLRKDQDFWETLVSLVREE